MSSLEPFLLDNHGERMVPAIAGGDTFWEHICRYRFALQFVRGKRVLDIACGEGYGAAALQRAGAASVIGVDISDLAVESAKQTYGIDARPGNAEAIPLPDRSLDVVVSFETIEHVPHPEKFLTEIKRVIVPGGMLVLSTPNQGIYRKGEERNEFHLSEMSAQQFRSLVSREFSTAKFFAQRCTNMPWLAPRILRADWEQLRRIPGLARIRRGFQRILNRPLANGPTDAMRRDPVQTILQQEGLLASSVNPYAVIPWRESEVPTYLVAVARN